MSARIALAVVFAGFAAACSKPDPLYCDEDTPCEDPDRPFCDLHGDYPASDGIDRTCIAEPSFAVSLSDDDAQVRIGGTLDLEITIDRIDDFPGDVTITADGLPDGASADPLTIPDGATSGTLTIQGGDADPGALASATVTAAAGPIERAADLRLLVLGPAGSLDPTFGSNGLVGEPTESNMDDATALMRLPDGSILVGGPNTAGSDEAVLVRYSGDGQLDTSFGSGGWTQITFDDSGITVNATIRFAQQSDGKIVIANGSESGDLVLARLTAEGELDPTFAGGGMDAVQISGGIIIWVEAIGIGPDDEIVVAMARGTSREQMSVVRFDRDGAKDLSFASGRFDLDRGTNHLVKLVSVSANGSVLFSGTAYQTDPPAIPFIARLTSTGSIDDGFGDQGILDGEPAPVVVEGDGALLTFALVAEQAVFRRLTPSGDPDPSFGEVGELQVTVPAGWDAPSSFLPEPAGVLAVGRPDITLSRFDLAAGELDAAFGDGGLSTVVVENIVARRALRQADGRVIVLADEDSYPFVLARFFE